MNTVGRLHTDWQISDRCLLDLSKFSAKSVSSRCFVNIKVKRQGHTPVRQVSTSPVAHSNSAQPKLTGKPKSGPPLVEDVDQSRSLRELSNLPDSNKENDQLSSILASFKELKQGLVTAKRNIAEIKAKQGQTTAQADSCIQNMEKLTEDVSNVNNRLSDVDFIKLDIAQIKAKQSQTSNQLASGIQHLVKITGDVSQVSSRLSEVDALRFSIYETKAKEVHTATQMAMCRDCMHKLTEDVSNTKTRLSEVDSLKHEIKSLQQRINSQEDEKRTPQFSTPLNHPQQPQSHLTRTQNPSSKQISPTTSNTPINTMPPPTKPASAYHHRDNPLRSIETPIESTLNHVLISPRKTKRRTLPHNPSRQPNSTRSTRPSNQPPNRIQRNQSATDENTDEERHHRAKRRRTGSHVPVLPQTPKPRGRPPRVSSTAPE